MANLRGRDRSRYVARMFARISWRYDLMNSLMTARRHYAWRRMAAEAAVGGMAGAALDVATGTGDFAVDLARRPAVSRVVGIDFTPEMLSLAARKAMRKGLSGRLALVAGDAHSLPFPDGHFICATVGFGLRNFVDVPLALREMTRVVRPGGRVAVLEIVRVDGKGPLAALASIHFRWVTPWLGALLAGDRQAYTYLPESVNAFHTADEIAVLMEEAGLGSVRTRKLGLGTVAIHVGEKP